MSPHLKVEFPLGAFSLLKLECCPGACSRDRVSLIRFVEVSLAQIELARVTSWLPADAAVLLRVVVGGTDSPLVATGCSTIRTPAFALVGRAPMTIIVVEVRGVGALVCENDSQLRLVKLYAVYQ